MSGHHTYRILMLIGLAWLIASPPALAQEAFNDSIAALSVRVEERLAGQERMRITVLDLTDPSGRLGKELITYVEEVLIMHLSQRPRITLVERRALDQVLEEQRRTASGTFDEEGAIEIGRLMAADALITGSIFRVDGRMHLILRLLDTGTGVMIGTEETYTDFPRGKEPGGFTAQPPTPAGDRQGAPEAPPMELRAWALGASHFGRAIGGAGVEVAVRSKPDDGARGHVGIGVQLGFWPAMASWAQAPFDVGHVRDIREQGDGFGTPTVRFGNTDLRRNDLFLMAPGEEQVWYQPVTVAGGGGLELLEYERVSLRNVSMHMVGGNIPLRWYLGSGAPLQRSPKIYMEFGFGMDMVIVSADHVVTTTLVQLDASDLTYATTTTTRFDDAPLMGSVGRHLYFTHMSFGGGIEMGRFNLSVLGRYHLSSKFTDLGRAYDRVRGNIVAYPLLAGVDEDRRVMSDLERDGAIRYGALDLERIRSGDQYSGGGTTTGNGVDRFWQRGHLLFGVAFRFL
jgi:hypothetical protein